MLLGYVKLKLIWEDSNCLIEEVLLFLLSFEVWNNVFDINRDFFFDYMYS